LKHCLHQKFKGTVSFLFLAVPALVKEAVRKKTVQEREQELEKRIPRIRMVAAMIG